MEATFDENYDLLDQKVRESLNALDETQAKYDKAIVNAARLYNIKNAADKLTLDNNKVEYEQENKERAFEQQNAERELELKKIEYERELDIQRLELEKLKLDNEKSKIELDKIRLDIEHSRLSIESQRLSFDENKATMEEKSKQDDRVIRLIEIAINLAKGMAAGIVGISEFNAMMNFETDGGFFKGWAGRLFTRERRREKGDY